MTKLIILAALVAAIVPGLRSQVAWSQEDFAAVNEAVEAATPTNAVAAVQAERTTTVARIADLRKRLAEAKGRDDLAAVRSANSDLTKAFCSVIDEAKAQAETTLERQRTLRDRLEKLLLAGKISATGTPASRDAANRAARVHDGLFSADGLGALGVDSYSRGLAAQLAVSAKGNQSLVARLGQGADPLAAYNRAALSIQTLERNLALYDTVKGLAIARGIEVALSTLAGAIGDDIADDPVLGAVIDTLGTPEEGEAATGPIAPIGGEDDSLYY